MDRLGKMTEQAHRPFTVLLLYIVAVALSACSVSSIPYPPQTFAAEIQLNEAILNGSLNGAPVEGLTTIQLGNWGARYYDSNHQNGAIFEGSFPYSVTITNSKDNSTTTIVQGWYSYGMILHIAAFVATVIATFPLITSFRVKINWLEYIVYFFDLTVIICDIWLFFWVAQKLPSLIGESVVTHIGNAIYLDVAVLLAMFVAVQVRRSLPPPDAEKKKSTTTVSGSAIDAFLNK